MKGMLEKISENIEEALGEWSAVSETFCPEWATPLKQAQEKIGVAIKMAEMGCIRDGGNTTPVCGFPCCANRRKLPKTEEIPDRNQKASGKPLPAREAINLMLAGEILVDDQGGRHFFSHDNFHYLKVNQMYILNMCNIFSELYRRKVQV